MLPNLSGITGNLQTRLGLLYLYRVHDDVIKWKHLPRYWPFVRGIHWSPVNSRHKGQWRGALMFSLICALNKRLNKQSWGWWFETRSCPLWRHCNEDGITPTKCWVVVLLCMWMTLPPWIFCLHLLTESTRILELWIINKGLELSKNAQQSYIKSHDGYVKAWNIRVNAYGY